MTEDIFIPKEENSFSKKKTLILFFIFLIIFILGYFLLISAPTNFPKNFVFEVVKGDSLREVSLNLKEAKLIKSRAIFETFVILFGDERHISPGDYLFENKIPVFLLAQRIAKHDRQLASVRITIPEGFDKNQISELADTRLKNFDQEKFLAEAKEGYLFPDTYFFFSTDTEVEVLEYLTENFEKKMKMVEKEILASGKSKEDILIMASLIEREAKGDQDRGYISGILWKRISKNMPLQVDAAPETYKEKGLPKEPICNSGLKAIKAALYPVNSDYLYYLHDKNGAIHFARTFEEHKKNKIIYLK